MRLLRFTFATLLVLCPLTLAYSQVATGISPYGTYDNHGFDTINVGNLNVDLSVPVFAKTGRGGLNFQYALTYDSSIWTPVASGGSTTWQPALQWGWGASTSGVTGLLQLNVTTGTCAATSSPSTDDNGFSYIDTNGTLHSFTGSISDCSSDPDNAPFTAVANDPSGYTLTVSAVGTFILNDVHGKTITPVVSTGPSAAAVIDLNGNQISISSSGNVIDTTGTTVIAMAGSGTPSSPTVYTYPVWLNSTSSTTSASVTVHYASYNVVTAFGCSGVSEYSQSSVPLVSYVTLADGEQYSFNYETTPGSSSTVTGRLLSITLPTGGVITYAYSGGSNGIVCADGGTAGLSRTTSDSYWTYARTPGSTLNTSHTDTVDGLGNHTSYDFLANTTSDPTHLYFLTHEVQYKLATSTVLLDTSTCFKYITGYFGTYGIPRYACSSTSLGWPVMPSPITLTYDGIATMSLFSSRDSAGNIWGVSYNDFGSGSPGASIWTWSSDPGTASGTWPLPQYVSSGGNGATEVGEWHAYNFSFVGLTATTGLPQHSGIPAGTYSGSPRALLNQVWPDIVTRTSGFSYLTSMTYSYDDAGQLRTSTDMTGNTTTYTYDSGTDTFPTQITGPSIGGSTQTVYYNFDVASGALKSTTDQNGNTTSYTYDNMMRPLTVTYPDGGVSTNSYSLASSSAYVTSSVLHAAGSSVTTTTYLDGYARTLTQNAAGANVGYTYDGNGNIYTVSNPYTSSASLYTQYTYDALGRPTSVLEADGSTASSVYSGNTVTVIDEAGHPRETVFDGVGRIKTVFEADSSNNPTIETDYLYDQNPTTSAPYTYQTIVNQKGGSSSSSDWRTRTFTYTRGQGLLSENTPEGGTTSYTYSNGTSNCSGSLSLICSRTDANGTVTNYSYDAMNRPTGQTYSGSTIGSATSAVSYYYDQTSFNGLSIANGKGQMTGMSDGSGSTAWSFDQVGRTLATRKTIGSTTKQASYAYHYDGSIDTLEDFGGTTLTYSYDGYANPTGVTDGSGNSYASNATYNPAGQLTGLQHQLTSLSPLYTRSLGYNSRLQPNSIQASEGSTPIQNLSYTYGTPTYNNGNISMIANGMDTTHSRDQNFLYDNVNRLKQAQDGTHWGEQYIYDNWGNLEQKSRISGYSGGDNWSVTPDIYNHLSNLSYDSAGQVTMDQLYNNYTYDAEGRLLVAGQTGSTASYSYDGNGYRVSKTFGGTTTLYWPSIAGITDESNSAGTSFGKQVNFAGLQVWSEDTSGMGKFLFQDHLGSTRITASSSGTLYDDLDYLPFGEITANYGTASNIHYQFTGDESDVEDSSDYATFRNLSGYMGRFNRADPYDGSYDLSNPQSMNRYSYVSNAPLTFVDPYGLAQHCSGTTSIVWYQDAQGHWHTLAVSTDSNCQVQQSGDSSDFLAFAYGYQGGSGLNVFSVTVGYSGSGESNRTYRPGPQTAQACLNRFNSSLAGKAANFLSPVSMVIGPDAKTSRLETIGGAGIKFGVVNILHQLGKTAISLEATPGRVLAGLAADAVEAAAETVVLPAVLFATTVQGVAHLECKFQPLTHITP